MCRHIFRCFQNGGKVVRELEIMTRRLDDIEEVDAVDFLKMDVQARNYRFCKMEKRRLSKTAAAQVEVSFIPIYKDQPVFGEIDLELRGLVPLF